MYVFIADYNDTLRGIIIKHIHFMIEIMWYVPQCLCIA